MKISRMIGVGAFAILASFLVISASSVYVSTENDLKSLGLDFEEMQVKDGKTFIIARLNGNNSGIFPSHIEIMNHTLTINPETSMSQNVSLPVNLSKLKVEGWTGKSIIYFFTIFVSEFLSGFNLSRDSQNVSTLIPPFFTQAKLIKNNSNGQSELILSGVLPILITIFKVSVFAGKTFLGNLSASGNGNPFNGTVNLIGQLNEGNYNGNLTNLSFTFLGTRWSIPGI